MSEKITAQHLERRAVVYVRQSTPKQVSFNQESRLLQYAMRERLRDLGWSEVDLIDDDLGCTASGAVQRPGFERLVTRVGLGELGAVAARDVSRFARNNQEWSRLVEICAVVDTLLIDHETVYDARNSNDRLLLGLKGNLSAYELDLLRHRALAARQAKAKRGEYFPAPPPGFVKTDDGRLEKDPDQRVHHAIRLLFDKTLELGSARQAGLWFLGQGLEIPVQYHDGRRWSTVWRPPTSLMIVRMLRNPMYAGAYAFGRRRIVTQIDQGLPKRVTRCRPRGEYEVLIPDHHEGYVTPETFERVQRVLTNNAAQRSATAGAPKPGNGLLTGLLRCGRCGQKLRVTYTGTPRLVRYMCDRAQATRAAGACIAFGGTAVDRAVSDELVRVLAPAAIEAAALAADDLRDQRQDALESLRLEFEAARFEAIRAQRQYDAVDPDNRLVAGELEARWNQALEKASRAQGRLEEERAHRPVGVAPDRAALRTLAEDLERVWSAEPANMSLKKRIARALIEEMVVDISPAGTSVDLVIHWKGGVHTPLSVVRRRRGQHFQATSPNDVDAIRVLARVCTDDRIAQALNRSGSRTGTKQVWTRSRVKDARHSHEIAVYDAARQRDEGWLKLGEAAAHLGVTPLTVRRYIERGTLNALHPLNRGPWVLRRDDLDRPAIRRLFEGLRGRRGDPGIPPPESASPLFPEWR